MNRKLTDHEIDRNIRESENGFLYQHKVGFTELIITEVPDNLLEYGSHHFISSGLKITLSPQDSDEAISILLPESERKRLKEKL